MTPACENCKFWEPIHDADGVVRNGYCVRYAPSPKVVARDGLGFLPELNAVWPITAPDDFCGEGTRK